MEKTNFLLESEMKAIVGGGDISLKSGMKERITGKKLQKPEEITLSVMSVDIGATKPR